MDRQYQAAIRHTEQTIRRLYKTEYHTYGKMRMLVRLAIGAVMVVLALVGGLPMAAQGILLLLGCWLLISRDFPATSKAEQVLEKRRGDLPRMGYVFTDEGLLLDGEGKTNLGYDRIKRLVEDEGYLYLFLAADSVCMVDRAEIGPGKPEELMDFLAERTGLPWTRDRSLLSMNLGDLRQAIRDWKQR